MSVCPHYPYHYPSNLLFVVYDYHYHYPSVEPQTCTIPTWILETINTRNSVTILPEVRLAVQQPRFANALKQYKNNPSLFIKALQETLEADVRSKFQTKRRQEDCRRGVPVEVTTSTTHIMRHHC
jgi:hypothetical protein